MPSPVPGCVRSAPPAGHPAPRRIRVLRAYLASVAGITMFRRRSANLLGCARQLGLDGALDHGQPDGEEGDRGVEAERLDEAQRIGAAELLLRLLEQGVV